MSSLIGMSKLEGVVLPLGGGACLRTFEESDISALYVDSLNDPEVHRFLSGPRKQLQTMETVCHFVRTNRVAHDGVLLGLFVGGILRGTLRLHNATDEAIYLGLAIFDKRIWGVGWGRKMITAAAQYAVDDLGIAAVFAGIESANYASQKAFLAAGFINCESQEPDLLNRDGQIWRFVRALPQDVISKEEHDC